MFNTETYKIYVDNDTERIQYGGDTDLVTSISDASSTNTFSGSAIVDLFLQKTACINSASTALAVTTDNIPLGCKAFAEEIGADDISSIADGTVSGALTQLDDQLTANSTRIYLDYQNGKYGYNTDSARGADTFSPFNNISLSTIKTYSSGTSSTSVTYTYTFTANYDYVLVSSINILVTFGGAYTRITPTLASGSTLFTLTESPGTAGNVSGGGQIMVLKNVKSGDKLTFYYATGSSGATNGTSGQYYCVCSLT